MWKHVMWKQMMMGTNKQKGLLAHDTSVMLPKEKSVAAQRYYNHASQSTDSPVQPAVDTVAKCFWKDATKIRVLLSDATRDERAPLLHKRRAPRPNKRRVIPSVMSRNQKRRLITIHGTSKPKALTKNRDHRHDHGCAGWPDGRTWVERGRGRRATYVGGKRKRKESNVRGSCLRHSVEEPVSLDWCEQHRILPNRTYMRRREKTAMSVIAM
jgi:hypothetical protein